MLVKKPYGRVLHPTTSIEFLKNITFSTWKPGRAETYMVI